MASSVRDGDTIVDCSDAAGMVADMKARYEAPLLTIFRLDGEGQA